MKKIIVLSFFLAVCAKAEVPEITQLDISGFVQSCMRRDASDPFQCNSPDSVSDRVSITLAPVPSDPHSVEESASEGSSEEIGLDLKGEGQYIVKAIVRKSVGLQGKSILYRFKLQAHKYIGNEQPTVYTTSFSIYDDLKLEKPMMLMADRHATSDKFFRQVYFLLSQ